MRIRKRIIFSLLILSLLGGGAMFYGLIHSFEKSFKAIEVNELKENYSRVEGSIQSIMDGFELKIKDWAYWDDSYAYINHPNDRYIQSNFLPESLKNVNVEAVYMLKLNFDVVFYKNLSTQKSPFHETLRFIKDNGILNNLEAQNARCGFSRFQDELHLFCATPISKSSSIDKSINGYMIFMRNFGSEDLKKLSRMTYLEMQLHHEHDDHENFVHDKINFNYEIKDITGKKIAVLDVSGTHLYSLLFNDTKINLAFGIGIFCILNLLMTYYLLRKIVLNPLYAIKNQAQMMGKGQLKDDIEISVARNDEFSELANSLNTMIRERDEQRRRLQGQFYLSSLGEMASGIAHEINNPISIISLHADKIQRRYPELMNAEPELAKSIFKIADTSKRIAKIIKTMKTLSKESNHDTNELICLPLLVEETIDFYRERSRNNEIQIQFECEDYNVWINGNTTDLSQLLISILNNAFERMALHDERKIRIMVNNKGDECWFSLWIKNVQLPEDQKARILGAFNMKSEIAHTPLGWKRNAEVMFRHKIKFDLLNDTNGTILLMKFKQTSSRILKVS